MPDYTLSAKITGDSSDYQESVNEAQQSTEQFSKEVSSTGSKLASVLSKGLKTAATAVAGLTSVIAAATTIGVKYNAQIEQYQTSFEVMTGSAEKAADVVERLKKMGAATPFELPDLADVTQLLMNYGFTADSAIESMMMLGDISQGSAEKMQRVAAAYGQMSSAGKVSLEDVKQMIEAGFNPLQEISESTGESMESLYDRISDGTLAVDEITASMKRATSEGGKYFKSMEKQSQTINGLISTLKDNAQQLLGDVIEPITESFGSKLLPEAISAIEDLSTAFQEQGLQGMISVGGKIISNILLGISQALPGLISTSVQILQSIVSSITENMPQFVTAGGSILLSIVSGILQLSYMVGELVLSLITTALTALVENAPMLVTQAASMFTSFLDTFRNRLPEVVQMAADMVSSLLTGLVDNAPTILEQAGTMMEEFLDTILGALPLLLDAGTEIIANLLQGITENGPSIIEQIGSIMIEFVGTIWSYLPDLLISGGEMITTLLAGLVDAAPGIISQAASMLIEYVQEILSHLPEVLEAGISLIGELLAGILEAVPKLIMEIPGIALDIIETFLSADWLGLGWDILSGIGQGIMNAVGSLIDTIWGGVQSAINTVKGWLGIASPSKYVAAEIGEPMGWGVGEGYTEGIPVDDMKKSMYNAVDEVQEAYYSAARMINPSQTVMGTSHIAKTYQADVSNIFEGMVIQIENVTNLDGQPIYEKSAQYTIQKIGNQQRAVRRSRGLSYA